MKVSNTQWNLFNKNLHFPGKRTDDQEEIINFLLKYFM
tara:strand:- start:378 stop:491 length:114 start_codon:yes stop_codon:yes gene_type:complete